MIKTSDSHDFSSLQRSMTEGLAYDGEPARLVELKNKQGMSLVFMDIGATWLSCQIPLKNEDPLAKDEKREVLLGLDKIKDFYEHQSYMGVVVGRYANRIKNGRFSINGHTHQVVTQKNGHCLHGGIKGVDKYRWDILRCDKNKVTFSLISPDGDQGFSGTLEMFVTYTLTDENELNIEYQAKTDKPTPVNLTNHAYFNLMGAESGHHCLDHEMYINALYYQPTDSQGIPNAALTPVANTSFDFTQAKPLKRDFLQEQQQENAKGYDHSFWFGDSQNRLKKPVAILTSPDKKIQLQVFTDKPAMQLYTGNWLLGTPSRLGGEYADYAGVALETQLLPDSPNHKKWQHLAVLYPDKIYKSLTRYAFIVS